jgi:hypothetical protein
LGKVMWNDSAHKRLGDRHGPAFVFFDNMGRSERLRRNTVIKTCRRG